MIVITGASGVLGRQVVDHLLERGGAENVGISVRDPESVAERRDAGVRVRRGDYTDPDSLAHAFEGADRVLLVSGNTLGDDGVAQHGAAIEAARAAGVQRIFYTSHQAAAPDSRFAAAVDHARTEDLLAASGVAWTSLRNGFYANTPLYFLRDANTTGRLVTPEDGPVAWADRTDLAEAAAVLLLSDNPPDGPTAPLTGPIASSFDDVAAAVSTITGQPVRHETVDDEQWVRTSGMPEPYARLLLGLFVAARAREFDAVDPAMERLIGHRPRTAADAMKTELA